MIHSSLCWAKPMWWPMDTPWRFKPMEPKEYGRSCILGFTWCNPNLATLYKKPLSIQNWLLDTLVFLEIIESILVWGYSFKGHPLSKSVLWFHSRHSYNWCYFLKSQNKKLQQRGNSITHFYDDYVICLLVVDLMLWKQYCMYN